MKRKYIIGISLLVAILFAASAAVALSEVQNLGVMDAEDDHDMGPLSIIWDAQITLTEPATTLNTDWVMIGEDPLSWDGVPPLDGNDIGDTPAPPDGINAYLIDDPGFAFPLLADYRFGYDTSKTWNLSVEYSTGTGHPNPTTTINMTWNPSDFVASEYANVDLYQFISPSWVLIGSMKAIDYHVFSITDPGPGVGIESFEIRCTGGTIPLEGENCFNPFVVDVPGDLDYFHANTTCGKIDDYFNTDLGYYDGGEDAIYRLDVSADTMVLIQMTPTASWSGIGLFTDCPDVTGTMVASDTGSDKADPKGDKGLREITYTLLAAESPYYLMLDIWPTPYCYDYDLSIEAIHDVGVTAINDPTMPVYINTTVPVQVEVENYGNDETAVPVHVWIDDASTPPVVLLDEDFEAWPPAKGPTWQITNNGGVCVWESTATTGELNPFGTGEAADANSDWCGSGSTMNTDLVTPSIDTSTFAGPILLEFDFNNHMIMSDYCDIAYSPNGGATWYTIITLDSANYVGAYHWTIDFTGLMVPDLMISWTYYAAGWYYDCQLDNVFMVGNLAAKGIVYDEYMYPDMDMGDNFAVDFPDWDVTASGNYTVNACTELPSDGNPTNDCMDILIEVPAGIVDVGVTEITNPPDHVYVGDPYTVEATVCNYGTFPQDDIPVHVDIYWDNLTYVPPPALYLEEDFEGTFPPTGWTVINNAVACAWDRNDLVGTSPRTNYAGGDGYCADADADKCGSGATYPMDTELLTPSMDLSPYVTASLTYVAAYNYLSGDYADCDISIDGGTSWTTMLHWAIDHDAYGPGETVTLDLSPYCGNSDVIVRWHYFADSWDYYYEIDQVNITALGPKGAPISALEPIVYELVYSADTTIDLGIGACGTASFSPDWVPFETGAYLIEVTCNASGDIFPGNDSASKIVTAHIPNVLNVNQGLWYTTIQEAVDAASPFDILQALPIVFEENVVVPITLTIMPYGTGMPVLDGNTGDGFYLTADGGVVIFGFEITDCLRGVVLDDSQDCTIRNNTIHGNSEGVAMIGASAAINYNEFYDNGIGVTNYPGIPKATPPAKDKAVIISEGFEGTWVADPDGGMYMVPNDATYGPWDVDGLCTGSQSGYPQLTHYITKMADYGGYGLPHAGTYCAGCWWSDGTAGDTTQDEWLMTPELDLSLWMNLEFTFYGIWNWANAGDFVTIEVSTDGGATWTVEADLVNDPAYEVGAGGPAGAGWCWNEYQVVLDLSAYDMQPSVIIAYHLEGNPTMGAINYIDDVELTGDPAGGEFYTLDVTVSGNGHVELTPDLPEYYENTVVTLEAIADPSWEFSEWSGDLTGSTNPTTIVMDDDKFVTATFIVDYQGETGIHYNWFGEIDECDTPGVAIQNFDDLRVVLDARWNWYDACDGPSGGTIDAVTGRPADGFGFSVFGPLNFDPWAGLDAYAMISSTDVLIGEPIIFDASDSFACMWDGTLHDVSFLWSFGDGIYSMEEQTGHVYDAAGTFNAYLRVGANDLGLQGSTMYDFAYITITVSPPGMPLAANADANFGGGYEGVIEEDIQFYGSATGGTPPYSYEWNFGDGATAEEKNPVHDYDESGTYTVTLTVTDSLGSTAIDTADAVVAGRDDLVANAGGPYDGMKSENIFFGGSASGGEAPYSYEWSFGDGSNAQGQYVQHIYDVDGTYTATLTVTDNIGNVDDHTTTVTVNKGESAEISNVKGGFGVKATIKAGETPVDWTITLDGKFVFGTTSSTGTIDANAIETVKAPFSMGFGKVAITITAGSLVEEHTAFMLGPFVLALK